MTTSLVSTSWTGRNLDSSGELMEMTGELQFTRVSAPDVRYTLESSYDADRRVYPGEVVTFTLTAHNMGNEDAQEVHWEWRGGESWEVSPESIHFVTAEGADPPGDCGYEDCAVKLHLLCLRPSERAVLEWQARML